MGLVVGDALGVPVEFTDRESLRRNPVKDMRGYGTYNLPPGSWSDDSSMTLCLLDSLQGGLDYKDIMDKFIAWFNHGDYTPHGQVFDVGIGTRKALARYMEGTPPLEAGGITEYDNGNGSLMRILPILFYLQAEHGDNFLDKDEAFQVIHNISSLTHRHKRSHIACGIYISIAFFLMKNIDPDRAVKSGISKAMEYYKRHKEYIGDLSYYSRIIDEGFADLAEEEIKSGGYVVDTLEVAIWCLLNTHDYKSCVLKAVNLGRDTDTTAAVVGGLAGLKYGYEAIPKEWLGLITRRNYIESMCLSMF